MPMLENAYRSPSQQDSVYRGAVLLRSLGTELAARVLSCLEEDEVELLIQEMARLEHISPQERDRILIESEDSLRFYRNGLNRSPEYARLVLEQTMGPEKAASLLNRGEPAAPRTLESMLKETPAETLVEVMLDEHPQLIAVMVSQLALDKAATVLSALPENIQGDLTARLVKLEAPAPIALQHLERILAEKLSVGGDSEESPAGPRRVADILSRMRRSVENFFLGELEQQSPELARQVNQYRFTFENLLEQDDRTLQRVLRDVDTATLPLVIKGLNDEQLELVYRNMSERAGERIREEVENLGPVRLRDVESAQQTMVGLARSLADKGEIKLRMATSQSEEEALV